jgi:glutathione S-transferase
MLTIWGRANSTNVKKALWTAEELGLPYERIEAGGPFGVVNEPHYRAMNPNGLVPTLQDGDLVLWESNTIVRYLLAKYGGGKFCPQDPTERAAAEKWMDWVISSLGGPYRDLFWNKVRCPPAERNEAEMAHGLKRCTALFTIADAALARRPYLTGGDFGLGDIPLGPYAYAWFTMDIERPELPHLAAWYQRLTERPAYRTAVMTPLT